MNGEQKVLDQTDRTKQPECRYADSRDSSCCFSKHQAHPEACTCVGVRPPLRVSGPVREVYWQQTHTCWLFSPITDGRPPSPQERRPSQVPYGANPNPKGGQVLFKIWDELPGGLHPTSTFRNAV